MYRIETKVWKTINKDTAREHTFSEHGGSWGTFSTRAEAERALSALAGNPSIASAWIHEIEEG